MGPMQDEFITADPEEAHAFMRAVYTESTMRIAGSRDGFRMRHTAAGAGSFSVAVMTHTMAVEHVAQPLGYPLIGRVLQGKIERETDRETVRAGLGDMFLVAQPDRPYTVRWDNVGLQMIQVSPAVLAEVAGVAKAGRLRFTSLVPESPASARNLAATVDFIASGLLASPEAAASPLLISGATRLLAGAMLTAFPHEADVPAERPPGPGGTATLRRAVAFIDEFAGADISAVDIAAGAHVTLRAVQHAFQRHLGTTPMTYLRRVRLDRARQELRSASPAHATVTQIANRWGFSSPSRFTAHYRAAYGELPRETLRHG